MYAKLYKLSTNPNALRTIYMEGVVDQEPTLGQSLMMVCKPLVPGAQARVIFTSPVKAIRETFGGIEFDTLNSTYLFERATGNELVH
jgi:hypothetical protein